MARRIEDKTLLQIATQITDGTKVSFLATALGFTLQDAEQFCSMNRDGQKSDGTLKMLKDWRDSKIQKEQKRELGAALGRCSLAELADIYLTKGTVDL